MSIILSWFAGNWLVVVICLAAVLLSMVSYLNGVMVMQRVNDAWVAQWNDKCMPPGTAYNRYSSNDTLPILNVSNWLESANVSNFPKPSVTWELAL